MKEGESDRNLSVSAIHNGQWAEDRGGSSFKGKEVPLIFCKGDL